MVLRVFCAIALSLFVAQQATAQCVTGDCTSCQTGVSCECACPGWYFSVNGGYNNLQNQISSGFQRVVAANFNGGYAMGGAIGYHLGNGFRMEGELGYRTNTVSTLTFNGANQPNPTGQMNNYGGMLNVYYDFPDLIGGGFTPYVGGGVGVSYVDADLRYGAAMLNGEDSGLTFQFMGGFSVPLSDRVDLFTEYRYVSVDDPKLNRFGGPAIMGAPQNIILNSEYDAHSIMAGLRVNLW